MTDRERIEAEMRIREVGYMAIRNIVLGQCPAYETDEEKYEGVLRFIDNTENNLRELRKENIC